MTADNGSTIAAVLMGCRLGGRGKKLFGLRGAVDGGMEQCRWAVVVAVSYR